MVTRRVHEESVALAAAATKTGGGGRKVLQDISTRDSTIRSLNVQATTKV